MRVIASRQTAKYLTVNRQKRAIFTVNRQKIRLLFIVVKVFHGLSNLMMSAAHFRLLALNESF